jgi:acetylornithine deacetylase/succinyl-diaminopimelate desuccinylase-like protein
MDPTELIHRIDEKRALDFLSEMVRHKSYSQTEGERELARFMAERMSKLGLEAELQPVEGERVNAVGCWRGQGGGRSLLFNGHIDTNPATEGWTVDPWGGIVDDKFTYGIGVSNMKAGDAAYFCAVKTLIEAGVKLQGDASARSRCCVTACGRTTSSMPSRRISRRSPCMPLPSPSSSSSSARRATSPSARRRSTRSWPFAI